MDDILDLSDHKGNIWVVGDIHGMYNLLMTKMRQQGFDTDKDILLSVGDLVDRGPDSVKCLELLDKIWFYAVRGNHEQMMYESITNPDFNVALWFRNGGEWFSSYNKNSDIIQRIDAIMARLPLTRTVKLPDGTIIGLVHAEPPMDWSDRFNNDITYDQETAIWSRNMIRRYQYKDFDWNVKNVDHVYCGHTIAQNPLTKGNISWIDTGAFHTNNLTMLKLT